MVRPKTIELPTEPTLEMIVAGSNAVHGDCISSYAASEVRQIYARMVEAFIATEQTGTKDGNG